MNQTENIKKLLDKYLEGQTSLKEEKQLRYYFLFEEVDDDLVSYKALFEFFNNEKQLEYQQTDELNQPFEQKSNLRILQYWKVAVAAVLIVGLGLSWYTFNSQPDIESLNHEEVLLAQKYLSISLGSLDRNYVKSAALLSNANRIEESTQKVRKMGEMYGSQREQLQHLNYIDQSFDKLKNIKSIQKSRIKLVM